MADDVDRDEVVADDELVDAIAAGEQPPGRVARALAAWRDTVIGADLATRYEVEVPEQVPDQPATSMLPPSPRPRRAGPVTYGIDVSRWQAGINLGQVAREGFDFVIAKISEGSTYRSPAWPAQRDGTRAAGMLLAGYHYVRDGDPAGQAANCAAAIGDPSIPVALDWEANSGNIANLRAVVDAFRAAGLRPVLGYLPRWYWAQVGSPDLTGLGLTLWSSRYPVSTVAPASVIYQQVTETTWAGYGGLNPAILQFTDRAQVAGLQVDANAFRGTRDQLAALLTGTDPAPDQPPPPPTPKEDPMAPIHIAVYPDGSFRGTTICEAGSTSSVVDRAWVIVGVTAGSADILITFYGDDGLIVTSDPARPGQRREQVTNNRRLWAEAPDGAVLATAEGRLTTGAQITGAVLSRPK